MARDSLVKIMYDRLFTYLVTRINATVDDAASAKMYIGLLDVYGFEFFEVNSFEQLCINFANEKLQQFFLETVFSGEAQVHTDEGVPWTPIEYADNKGIIAVIEEQPRGSTDARLDVPRGTRRGASSARATRSPRSRRRRTRVQRARRAEDQPQGEPHEGGPPDQALRRRRRVPLRQVPREEQRLARPGAPADGPQLVEADHRRGVYAWRAGVGGEKGRRRRGRARSARWGPSSARVSTR